MSEEPHPAFDSHPIVRQMMAFEIWWAELKSLAASIKYPFVYEENKDYWRDYWTAGSTPKEALKDDITYYDD